MKYKVYEENAHGDGLHDLVDIFDTLDDATNCIIENQKGYLGRLFIAYKEELKAQMIEVEIKEF